MTVRTFGCCVVALALLGTAGGATVAQGDVGLGPAAVAQASAGLGPTAVAQASAGLGPTAVAQASAGLGRVTLFHARFTTSHAGAASGLVLRTTGKLPAAGVTEAPAVRQTVVLPVGTKLRLGRLRQCTAGDATIGAQGAEQACPRSTRIGSGGADGVLMGAPVHFDLGIYAVRGHLVFAAEQAGKPLKQSFNGLARGGRLILTVPTLGGQIAPTGFHARIVARPGGKSWLRTPARCPRSRHWVARGRFQGVSTVGPGARTVTATQQRTDHVRCLA